MQEHLQKFKIFEIVGKAADELNCKAMVVGGYVRDLILNRPSKDIDIVVEGKGIELAEKVAKALQIKNVNVFKNFGTAQFNFEDWDIEFVGARKESYQRNSRNPIVETGTIKDDQLRRDFTINAMGISLNKNTFGELIDPFNGISDIEKKRIVTPQDPIQTFSDDPLRMLRAIRFASQLGFSIDPITYQSIVHNAYRLEIITIERVMDEFNKIMLSPKPSIGINLLGSFSSIIFNVFTANSFLP